MPAWEMQASFAPPPRLFCRSLGTVCRVEGFPSGSKKKKKAPSPSSEDGIGVCMQCDYMANQPWDAAAAICGQLADSRLGRYLGR